MIQKWAKWPLFDIIQLKKGICFFWEMNRMAFFDPIRVLNNETNPKYFWILFIIQIIPQAFTRRQHSVRLQTPQLGGSPEKWRMKSRKKHLIKRFTCAVYHKLCKPNVLNQVTWSANLSKHPFSWCSFFAPINK